MYNPQEQFALSNPISIITGKDPKDFTREDLIKVIIEKKIERVAFHYTGIDGKIKELRIPITNRQQAESILTDGERVDGSSLFKGIVDAGKSDLYVVPVYKSAFFNPFVEGSLDFICRFVDKDGQLANFAPDNILLNAVNLFRKETGMDLKALGELEFFLMYDNETDLFPAQKQKGYHAAAPFVKTGKVLSEMLRYITQLCGHVKYAHHEVGYMDYVESDFPEIRGKKAEQVEVEFLPMPIEEMADVLVLSRWIIRNVAYRHNMTATFVPKLENGHAGNGMHVHMLACKDGKNAMVDANGELSEVAKTMIGGLCNYAPSITAFGNTVSASYLRLVPHQEAPTKVCWSAMNRSALIRVPLGWTNVNNLASLVNPQQVEKSEKFDSKQTIELRSPDGSCNTHLLMAAIATAVEWGFEHQKEALELAAASHVKVNIHDTNTDDLAELATSCAESAEILLKSRDLYERKGIFPPQVISNQAKMLQNENDSDLNKRLMALPDDEKLKESRRVMHRDIHKH